jgi:hypothetical protein
MLHWLNCTLANRHDYGVSCEPGAIFLRCVHCGRRSPGWSLDSKTAYRTRRAGERPSLVRVKKLRDEAPTGTARVLPFERVTAS